MLEAKKDVVPSIVRAGKDTVGLRCPAHPLTLSLLERARLPLAGPSANPSGAPSPTTAQQVLAYFDGQIEGVIDGGECTLSRESTILDLTQKPFKILREGALFHNQIAMAESRDPAQAKDVMPQRRRQRRKPATPVDRLALGRAEEGLLLVAVAEGA